MAAKFLIVAFVILLASHIQASAYTTFASTYNAHSIHHAVAYPLASSLGAPTVAVPPVARAVSPSPIPASVPATANSVTPTAAPKPAIIETPAAGIASTSAAPFDFFTPSKVGFSSSPAAFAPSSAYPNRAIFNTGPVYFTTYGGVPSYGPAYSAAPAFATRSPAYLPAPAGYPAVYAGASPTYGINFNYSPASVVFASGSEPVSVSNSPVPVPAKAPVSTAPYSFW